MRPHKLLSLGARREGVHSVTPEARPLKASSYGKSGKYGDPILPDSIAWFAVQLILRYHGHVWSLDSRR